LGPRDADRIVVIVIVAVHRRKRVGAIDGGIVVVGVVLEGFPVARGRVGRRGAVGGDAAQARVVVLLVLAASPLLLDPQGHTKGRRERGIENPIRRVGTSRAQLRVAAAPGAAEAASRARRVAGVLVESAASQRGSPDRSVLAGESSQLAAQAAARRAGASRGSGASEGVASEAHGVVVGVEVARHGRAAAAGSDPRGSTPEGAFVSKAHASCGSHAAASMKAAGNRCRVERRSGGGSHASRASHAAFSIVVVGVVKADGNLSVSP